MPTGLLERIPGGFLHQQGTTKLDSHHVGPVFAFFQVFSSFNDSWAFLCKLFLDNQLRKYWPVNGEIFRILPQSQKSS